MKRIICAVAAFLITLTGFALPAHAAKAGGGADISKVSVMPGLAEGNYVFVGEKFRADVMAVVDSAGSTRDTFQLKSSGGIKISAGSVSAQLSSPSQKAQRVGSVTVEAATPSAAWVSAGTNAISSEQAAITVVNPPVLRYKATGAEVKNHLTLYAHPYADRSYTLTLTGFGGLGHTLNVSADTNYTGARVYTDTSTDDPEITITLPEGTSKGEIKLNIEYGVSGVQGFTGLKTAYSIYITGDAVQKFSSIAIQNKDAATGTMGIGSVVPVSAAGMPEGADEPVYWSSSAPGVVAINSSPLMESDYNDILGIPISVTKTVYLKALSEGTVTITVGSYITGKTDRFEVTVAKSSSYPRSVSIKTPDGTSIPARNGSLKLNAQILPLNANQRVTWKWISPSSPPSGWTISANGKLNSSADAAYMPGDKIELEAISVDLMNIATPTNARVTVTIQVVAAVAANSVVIDNPMGAPVAVGTVRALSAMALDASGVKLADQKVSWSSSNPSVATVDSAGRVKGVAAGSVTITATNISDKTITGTCPLIVTDRISETPHIAVQDLLAVRARPSSTSTVLGSLRKGSLVSARQDLGNGWMSIEYNKTIAYIQKSGVQAAQKVSVISETLSLRDKAGSAGAVVFDAVFGEELFALEPLSSESAWIPVLYKNAVLFVSKANIAKMPLSGIISAQTVKIRDIDSVYGSQIGTLKKGDKVEVVSSRDGFYKIKYGQDGKTGFISVKAVKIEK